MSLPKRNEKEYLHIEPSQQGYCIAGQKEHVSELSALFAQHGIPAQTEGEGVLHFEPGVDPVRLEELLESYKHVKGS